MTTHSIGLYAHIATRAQMIAQLACMAIFVESNFAPAKAAHKPTHAYELLDLIFWYACVCLYACAVQIISRI